MMKTEAELWAAAAEVVERDGADAPIFVAMEADAALADGDLDALHEWRIILRRTDVLLDRAAKAPN